MRLFFGLLIILIGAAVLAAMAYKDIKETDPNIKHFTMPQVLLALGTMIIGGLIFSDRVNDILDLVRGVFK